MDRVRIKTLAKENIKKNYVPWLIVAVFSVFNYFNSRQTTQNVYDSGFEIAYEWDLIVSVISIAFTVPLTRLAMHLVRGSYQKAGQSIFANEKWGRDIGAIVLTTLYTILWGILLIIPGVIKSYSYSFVPYILAENNTLTIKEAIALSQKLTDGHKWDLFVLDLSFILWNIAASASFGLLGLYVGPYQRATWAEAYRSIAG